MHWKQLGYVEKLDTWVPHELKGKHLTQRINSCDLLKKRNETDPFLKRLITGDEKWVVYNNIKRKRSWSRPREPARTTSKAGIHRKKVSLSVWWDYKGIVYFEHWYICTQKDDALLDSVFFPNNPWNLLFSLSFFTPSFAQFLPLTSLENYQLEFPWYRWSSIFDNDEQTVITVCPVGGIVLSEGFLERRLVWEGE